VNKEYILCAAIWYRDNYNHIHQPKNIENGFVICGRRHHNCFATAKIMDVPNNPTVQGFITSADRFLNRKDSAMIAYIAKQITDSADTLISEDLY